MAGNTKHQTTGNLRALADATALEALSKNPNPNVLLHVASELETRAQRAERENMAAVAVLPANATEAETRHKRTRQATCVGKDVYLPIWQKVMQIMPSSLLRSDLFSVSSHVQEMWADPSNPPLKVVDKKITTTSDVTMTLTGYELCQFDRCVYAACLNFYRERPLAKNSDDHIQTSFYALAHELGRHYGRKPHIAIRASLLRLSAAQLRIRSKRLNLELPKLLSVSFEDGEAGNDYKGADRILLQIPASTAELYGRGAWTAVDIAISQADGVRGWIGGFYASHSKEWPLSFEQLRRLSGYTSHIRNFTRSVTRDLDTLNALPNPLVESYEVSACKTRLTVRCVGWKVPPKDNREPQADSSAPSDSGNVTH